MIDFTSSQLSWLVVGMCSVGGTGYLTMDNKIAELDKKLSVAYNTIENTNHMLEKVQNQLIRIEEKLDKKKNDK